jgi:hypothetical protein
MSNKTPTTAWLGIAVLVLVGAGTAGWLYQRHTARERARKTVLMLVETIPKRAKVYLDGVLQKSKSLELERGKKYQVEGRLEGYKTVAREFFAKDSGIVRLVLGSARRARRRGKGDPILAAGRVKEGEDPVLAAATKKKVDGPLTRAQVKTAMDALRAPISTCFRQQGVTGTLKLRAKLHPNGHMSGVVLGKMAKTKTAKCVLRAVAKASTPLFEGRAVSVIFPFVLKEVDAQPKQIDGGT